MKLYRKRWGNPPKKRPRRIAVEKSGQYMRNTISVGRWARSLLNSLGVTPGQLTRQHIQNRGTLVLALALAIAGPIAIFELSRGAPLAFAMAVLALGATVSGTLLQRNGTLDTALLAQQAALGVATVGLAASPGLFDAGLLTALASLVYGLGASRTPSLRFAILPISALLVGIVIETVNGAVAAVPHPAFALVAALAASAMAVCAVAAGVRPADDRLADDSVILALEELAGAVIRYDGQGRPVYISRSASELLAAPAYELTENGLFERLHVQDRPVYAKALSDIACAGGRATLELRMRHDAVPGSATAYRWIEFSLAGVPGQATGPHDVVTILRDIGVRKAIEDDLRRARADAEQASDAKTQFLATIGHELRTPLNAIVGFSDMMVEGIGGTLSPTHRDYAGHICQSGHHLLEVVNMLLDMSKIDAGKFEIHAEAFAPHGLIEPCLKMVENLARDRNVDLVADAPDSLPQLVGDERACRQIIINLLSNAIKFSHDGGRVAFALRRQGKMLAISVADDGIGMPRETVRRIGEPFLQAHSGLSRRYEGTGLGLSIVKGLVSLHQGRLSVASEAGMGTRVTVLLPIDGPMNARAATVENLDEHRRETDEEKWQNDERRSATS